MTDEVSGLTLPERCRAQARSMDSEGWYVCANVLEVAADKIEELDNRIEAERADHQATIAHCEKYHCQGRGGFVKVPEIDLELDERPAKKSKKLPRSPSRRKFWESKVGTTEAQNSKSWDRNAPSGGMDRIPPRGSVYDYQSIGGGSFMVCVSVGRERHLLARVDGEAGAYTMCRLLNSLTGALP